MNNEDFVVMISRKTDRMQRVEFYCQPHDFGLRRTRRSTMAIVKPLRQPTLVSAGASWSRSIPYGLFVIVLPSTTPTAIVGICWNEVHMGGRVIVFTSSLLLRTIRAWWCWWWSRRLHSLNRGIVHETYLVNLTSFNSNNRLAVAFILLNKSFV